MSQSKDKNNVIDIESLETDSKKKGFVTYKEISKSLPDNLSVDDIEKTLDNFDSAGIDVVDGEDDINLEIELDEKITINNSNDSESEDDSESEEDSDSNASDEVLGTTDDPVRLYLRDMGGVELLSRDGEIEIAKRIESGKEIMIRAICECPLSMRYFIKLYEDLINEKIFLRELIDLEMAYNIFIGKNAEEEIKEDIIIEKESTDIIDNESEDTNTNSDDASNDAESPISITIVAMENVLMSSMIEKFGNISKLCSNLLDISNSFYSKKKTNEDLNKDKKYIKILDEIIEETYSIHLHPRKIHELLEKLYLTNKTIIAKESNILKLAEKHNVTRASFFKTLCWW